MALIEGAVTDDVVRSTSRCVLLELVSCEVPGRLKHLLLVLRGRIDRLLNLVLSERCALANILSFDLGAIFSVERYLINLDITGAILAGKSVARRRFLLGALFILSSVVKVTYSATHDHMFLGSNPR